MSETALWTGRPCIQAYWPYYLVSAILICLSAWTGASTQNLPQPLPAIGLTLTGLGIAAGIALALVAFLLVHANLYETDGEKIRRTFKLVTVKIDEAPVSQVTNIVVFQSVAGRILGYGHLRFDTAGTAFKGVTFHGVKNPIQTKKQIESILKHPVA